MRILLVGPPGSGKGTQAQLLNERLHIRPIGTGDLLRHAIAQETPAGRLAKPFVDRGELVPDDVVNQMVAEHFRSAERPSSFVMDGYPRNKSQAVAFDELLAELGLELDAIIELTVDERAVVDRLSGRRICPRCKAVYHVVTNPPQTEGVCDHDGAELVQRDDDDEETIRNRLRVYEQTNEELLRYYRDQGRLVQVGADREIDKVFSDIQKALTPR